MTLLLSRNMYVQVLTTIGGMSVVVIWYLARKVLARSKQPTKPRQFSDPAACARIIACTGYDDSGAKNQYTNLQSRAIPNKRLIRAFDIDNSFTTSEAQRRKEFNLEAGKAIKMTENKVGSSTPRKPLLLPQTPMCVSKAQRSLAWLCISNQRLGNSIYFYCESKKRC